MCGLFELLALAVVQCWTQAPQVELILDEQELVGGGCEERAIQLLICDRISCDSVYESKPVRCARHP